jgi:hypothetical protein
MAIRPLLQFYGMLALAKALVLGRSGLNLSTLPQSHGISDVSEPCKKIADLRVRLDKENDNVGMFQRFNDVASELSGLRYLDGSSTLAHIPIPAATSSNLTGISLSIQELLARVPELHRLYEQTFHAPAMSAPVYIAMQGYHWELQIVDPNPFSVLDDVARIVAALRDRFPFIGQWILQSAVHGMGGDSVLVFTNAVTPNQEFDPSRFYVSEQGFLPTLHGRMAPPTQHRVISEILTPLGSTYSNRATATAIAPLSNGRYISDYSVHYLALSLLSSLVRYRPNVWVHAISRSVADSMPADDGALAIIETFLELNAVEIPQLVAEVLGPQRSK